MRTHQLSMRILNQLATTSRLATAAALHSFSLLLPVLHQVKLIFMIQWFEDTSKDLLPSAFDPLLSRLFVFSHLSTQPRERYPTPILYARTPSLYLASDVAVRQQCCRRSRVHHSIRLSTFDLLASLSFNLVLHCRQLNHSSDVPRREMIPQELTALVLRCRYRAGPRVAVKSRRRSC